MDRKTPVARDRIRPLVALRAIRELIRNPDDTAQVFVVIDALSSRTDTRLFDRFRQTPTGVRLLEERPSLLEVLSDRERLLAMPAGTLGRAYGEFMSRERITADGLVEADHIDDSGRPDDRRWFGERLRDMHDLWHVTTGYQRDLVGEAALLALTYAQTRNPGIGFIVATAYWKAGGEARYARRLMKDAYRRGKRAAWLPGQDWEALLEQPLQQVREQLRLGDPPSYEQVRSAGAPALAS
jgi:ubiquinone biosynthesis protein COQ4